MKSQREAAVQKQLGPRVAKIASFLTAMAGEMELELCDFGDHEPGSLLEECYVAELNSGELRGLAPSSEDFDDEQAQYLAYLRSAALDLFDTVLDHALDRDVEQAEEEAEAAKLRALTERAQAFASATAGETFRTSPEWLAIAERRARRQTGEKEHDAEAK